MKGLADLEYRGYDSAGIGVMLDRQIQRRRAQGPLSFLAALLADEPVAAPTVIGHTRWATHGEPSRQNAHPHATSRVALVHNGIIENHSELRCELEQEGAQFRSDTDSEVIVWMLDRELANGADPLLALKKVLPRLRGSYALGVICTQQDDRVYAVRRGSPLALAHAGGASWLASDVAALGRVAQKSVSLEDGQIAELRPSEVRLFDSELRHLIPHSTPIATSVETLDRGAHSTFTYKEILEQPGIVRRHLSELEPEMLAGGFADCCAQLRDAERILAVGCGTSYYAAYTARAWLEQIAGIPVELELGSELKTRKPILRKGTVALLVSQSGETADTLAALRYLKQRNVPIVALVNVMSSAMAQEADAVLDCKAGREVGVASTKAFTAQLCTLAVLSIVVGRVRGELAEEDSERLLTSLSSVARAMENALRLDDQCIGVGRKIAEADHAIYLGRGANYPLALEAALKVKELSYIRVEGFAAGELKHGPLALIERGTPVVVLAPQDGTFDKLLSNVREVIARGGEPVLVGDADTAIMAEREHLRCIAVEDRVDPLWSPLVLAVPLQLIAYHAACARDRNVDRPRNLAKSVTVE